MYEDVSDNYSTDNDYQLFDNAQANACLIAAAPDLLEACIAIANGYKHKGEEMAFAAIAKATGELK